MTDKSKEQKASKRSQIIIDSIQDTSNEERPLQLIFLYEIKLIKPSMFSNYTR